MLYLCVWFCLPLSSNACFMEQTASICLFFSFMTTAVLDHVISFRNYTWISERRNCYFVFWEKVCLCIPLLWALWLCIIRRGHSRSWTLLLIWCNDGWCVCEEKCCCHLGTLLVCALIHLTEIKEWQLGKFSLMSTCVRHILT